jgi:DHA2 family multidrug resistance protein
LRPAQGRSVIASLAAPAALRRGARSFGARVAAARNETPPLGLVTLTVMLGLIMAIIDSSIVNVALTQMAGNLGATTDEISWVATSYIIASVVVMPLNGYLTAYFGRRAFYAGSLAIFTVASFLCGTAGNVWQLVAYRIVQGLGGGALQPTAQAILFEAYPPAERPRAMAIFGMGAMVGPAIGPTLGGYIVDNFNWPLIFLINIPIGIVAFSMTLIYVRDPAFIERARGKVDWIGLALMTAGVSSLQYVLERGQREDWFDSATIVTLSIVSLVGLALFVVRQLRDPSPLVTLSVFRFRSFAAGNFIGFITGFGLYGLNLVIPLFYQGVLGYSAMDTGLLLLPGAIATAFSLLAAGRLSSRLDPRVMIAFGLSFFAFGAWQLGGLNGDAGYWEFFWPRLWQGIAIGFIFVPLSTSTLSEIPRGSMAGATGVYTLLRQLGGGVGIAILQVIQSRREQFASTALASGVTLGNPQIAGMLHGAPPTPGQLAALAGVVSRDATILSYDYMFRVCALIFAVSVPTVLLLGRRKTAVESDMLPVAGGE